MGLAERKHALLNRCPSCMTVLADEQIEDGGCERCKTAPEKKQMNQWFFKITNYAQRLLDGLDTMDWSDITKAAQKNWIGRSQGAEVNFDIMGEKVTVFTTRPDTLWGATYMVLSPEHALLEKIVSPEQQDAVTAYVKSAAAKSDVEREEDKEKT
jgi:leucyl-tRNA synthetase